MFVLVLCLWSTRASAQGLDVGLSGIGLVSVQPIDETYSGVTLDSDIGTIRPGFGLGLSLVAPSGLVVGAEYTRADFEGTASGRMINGSGADQGRVREARLNSSLVGGMIGYGVIRDRTRLFLLVGGGVALYPVRLDDEPNRLDPVMMATGGVDLLRYVNARAAIVVTGRYAYVNRKFVIGPHVIRAGVGLRVRLN